MKKLVARGIIVSLVLGSFAMVTAGPASADCGIATTHFCAYRHAWNSVDGWRGLVLHSGAANGTDEVDVENDVVSSGRNGSNNHWCGMTNRVLSPPALVFDFAPNTAVTYVGDDKNDRIDWFKVRSGC